MNDEEKFYKNILRVININKQVKLNEIKAINYFDVLYGLAVDNLKYSKKYDDLMLDTSSRINFLIEVTAILLNSNNINQEIKELMLQLTNVLINYLTGESELQEIVLPSRLKEKMKDTNYTPTPEELLFLLNLIEINKKTYDEEIEQKDFSQTITEGLHTNITEVLRIERKKFGHLLGLTSSKCNLLELYKREFINDKITYFEKYYNIKLFDEDKNFNVKLDEKIKQAFNIYFKEIFGIDYSKENYRKLIEWKYKKSGEYQLTEEDKALNKTYDIMPKSNLLDYFTSKEGVSKLLIENQKNIDFKYNYFFEKYQREFKIIEDTKKNKEKVFYDKYKIQYNKEVINLFLNSSANSKSEEIRRLIDKFIEHKKLNEDQEFKKSFREKFDYEYPLIAFNELITKNVGFYNFSLMKDINSIIVDYASKRKEEKEKKEAKEGKETEENDGPNADTYIVSTPIKNMIRHQNEIEEEIEKDNDIYQQAINSGEQSSDLDREYINLLKSLMLFRPEDRYYFKFKEVHEHQRKIITERIELSPDITVIGFGTEHEEKERMTEFSASYTGEKTKIERHHYCETNMTLDYWEYDSDYRKNGIEYPINMIREVAGDGSRTRILKLSRLKDEIYYNIYKFNNLKYEKNNLKDIIYEKKLIDIIKIQINDYIKIKELNLNLYKYNNKNNLIYKIDNYIKKEEQTIINFKNMSSEIKKYFDEYNKIIELNYQDTNSKKRGK